MEDSWRDFTVRLLDVAAPGLNARYALDASHAGDVYEYALMTRGRINHDKSAAPWAL
jgi:hypothetical protein